jgi:hypothetical protein
MAKTMGTRKIRRGRKEEDAFVANSVLDNYFHSDCSDQGSLLNILLKIFSTMEPATQIFWKILRGIFEPTGLPGNIIVIFGCGSSEIPRPPDLEDNCDGSSPSSVYSVYDNVICSRRSIPRRFLPCPTSFCWCLAVMRSCRCFSNTWLYLIATLSARIQLG